MVLSTDLNSRLKDLFSKKDYQKLEKEIEKLGKVEELNLNIQFLYATSKALNKFSEKKDFKLAAYIYERLFKNNPSNLELFFNLIFTSVKATFFEYVEPHLLEQFKKNNSDPRILEGMGKMYSFYGDMNKANKYYQLLLNIKPEYKSVWYSFLAGMNYIADFDQDEYLKYCKEFNKSASINIENFKQEKSNVTKKVGFLSADFKTHSVSFFLEEVIKNIGENFELHALSNLKPSNYDDTTNNLKKSFHHWHELSKYQDENFVKYVRSLNLDIIIDLCGYTFNNRADALRARCAKTQITWCGYCNTLGLDNIDYLISDPNLIKKNEKNLYSEKILYMPNIWNAMIKPKKLPDIFCNEKKDNTVFTFGSFNNFKKISNKTIKTWSKILNNGNCKLVLKNSSSSDGDRVNQILLEKFKKEKVNLKNIDIIETKKTINDHLRNYNDIDLALDTFPYPGVTTSFESILMGVPVLTMKGFNFNSRCGESINKNLNLKDFIAENENDYVEKANFFKTKKIIDQKFKKDLRLKALNSCLFDTETFAKDFGSLLKSI